MEERGRERRHGKANAGKGGRRKTETQRDQLI